MKRALGVTISLVLVVALVLVGADRWAAHRASSEVAQRARSALSLSKVDASAHGFPFVTQVLGDRLHHLTVATPQMKRNGATFDDVTVDAYDVAVKREGLTSARMGDRADHATAHIGSLRNDQGTLEDVNTTVRGIGLQGPLTLGEVDGTGIVSTTTIAARVKELTRMDMTVSRQGSDLVVTGTVLGQKLSATATPSLATNGVRVALDHVMLGDTPVSAETVQRLSGLRTTSMTVPVDLSAVPGLKLTGVRATDAGLELHLAGKNLTLRSS